MRIRTSSIRFCVFTLLRTHNKCKAIIITWPLHLRHMTITVRTVPAKMAILLKIVRFRVTQSSWPWTFAWPHMLTRALVWSFIQPAVFTVLNRRVHMWALIDLSTYKTTNNVYIVWLQVRIHFELNRKHLLKWIGSKPVWIQFGPIHFWCEHNKCALNQIECA